YDLSQKVVINEDCSAMEQGRADCVLKAGQSFSVKSLLNLMLVESNSSAAQSLANVIGQDKFVDLMNAKAREIGLASVNFSTPVGRGETNLLSVHEVAKLMGYILADKPEIFQMSAQKNYALYDFSNVFVRNSKNIDELLFDSDLGPRIVGGKTGETADAGQCLALVAKSLDNKNYLVNVILNSSDRFEEMKKMINWADENYIWPDKPFDASSLDWKEAVKSAPWEARDSGAVVVYNNKIWLMGGLDANGHMSKPGFVDYNASPHFSDVWNSDDGINWKQVAKNSPWGNRRSIELVNFKGKIWLMGGYSPDYGYRNDVWSTTDGINWKQETASAAWPAREGHQLVVFQDKIWLIGGVKYDKGIASATSGPKLFNDVWYSSDGINWTEATNNAAWAPRWDHAVGIFQNKLWLVDGMVFGSAMFSDVWSSADGVTWIKTADGLFDARQGNYITEYKGKLWVIGKMKGGGNDVWHSDDGVNWQKTKNDPMWLGREDFCGAIFKDKIWILEGMDINWHWNNDIWYSTF
ncbi:MAG: serine hydrolase, partial [Candidatus Staskawiczbacteria bacterium]|nr:serine hydrolase [Candidatus Staskawiczbacteria bacterium]